MQYLSCDLMGKEVTQKMETTVVTQTVIPAIGAATGNASGNAQPAQPDGAPSTPADFMSLIASLFINVPVLQAHPEAASTQQGVLSDNGGAGEVLSGDVASVKVKKGSLYLLQQLLPAEGPATTQTAGANGRKTMHAVMQGIMNRPFDAAAPLQVATDDSGETVQQLPPETEYLINVNPDTAFVIPQGVNPLVPGNNALNAVGKDSQARMIAVSPAAAGGGEIVVPVELKSGEKITVVFRENTAGTANGKVMIDAGNLKGVRFANPEAMPGQAASAIPATVITEVIREEAAPLSRGSSTSLSAVTKSMVTSESAAVSTQNGAGAVSQEVVRIVVVVKRQPAAEVARPAAEVARPVAEIARPAGEVARPAAEIARPAVEVARPLTGSIVAPEQKEATENMKLPQPTANSIEEMPEVARPVLASVHPEVKGVNAPVAGAEILVVNQSSRHMEVVVRSENAMAQVNGQSAGVAAGAEPKQVARKQETDEISGLAAKVSTISTEAFKIERPGKPVKIDENNGAIPLVPSSMPDFTGKVEAGVARTSLGVPVEHLLEQVSSKASSFSGVAGQPVASEMTFTLQPDRLGNLQMKVSVEGDQVVMKILVDNPAVKQALENNLGQLRDSFGNAGLKMEGITVSLGMNSGWERGQGSLWQGQERAGGQAQYVPGQGTDHRREEPVPTVLNPYRSSRERLLDMMI